MAEKSLARKLGEAARGAAGPYLDAVTNPAGAIYDANKALWVDSGVSDATAGVASDLASGFTEAPSPQSISGALLSGVVADPGNAAAEIASDPPAPSGTAIDTTPPGQQMQPTLPAGPRYGIASTTVTDTKHPTYSKAEAVQRVGAEQAAADAQAGNVRQWASDTGAVMQGQVDELQSQYQQQREQLSSIGAESAGLKNRYDRLDAEFAQAKEDVKDAVPIAGATIPTYSRVLTGLAAIMEGFAAGVNRRKSNAGKIVQSALNRDFQAQRAVYADKLRDMNVTAQQRSEAMRRIDMLDTRKQIVLSRQAQIKAAQVGYQTKSLSVRKQSEDTVFALGQGVRALNDRMEQLSRPQKQSRTTTKKVPLAGGTATPGGLDPRNLDKATLRVLKKEIAPLEKGVTVAKRLAAKLDAFDGKHPLAGRGFTAASKDITSEMMALIGAVRKSAGDSGPMTEPDKKTFDRISDEFSNGRLTTKKDMLRRTREMVGMFQRGQKAAIENAFRGPGEFIQKYNSIRGVTPGAAKFGGVKQ